MLEEQEFGRGMTLLLEAFRVELSQVAMEAYWISVQDMSSSSWSQAIMRALKEAKFMPRASELRDFGAAISSDDRAIAAWSEVRNAIAQHGVYQTVDFEDRIVNAAIRGMGGWRHVCMMPCEEFDVWGRKEFERQYTALARRGVDSRSELARPLPGIIELTNVPMGMQAPEPKRIPASTPTIGQMAERRAGAIESGELRRQAEAMEMEEEQR